MDSQGNLYGTAEAGGADDDGTAYELAPGSGTIVTLASFNGTDGANPVGRLIMDSAGNLLGTTVYGGANNDGTLFCLAPASGTITTLASCTAATGTVIGTGLTMDGAGDLFGMASQGGADGDGTLFELPHGTDTLVPLINYNGANGATPGTGDLLIDASGDIFGTTPAGGDANGDGTVFELTPAPTAAQLTVGQAPSTTLAYQPFSLTLDLKNGAGQLDVSDTSRPTISILSGPIGGGVIQTAPQLTNGTGPLGVTAATFQNGVDTVANLSLSPAGNYTLPITDGSLSTTMSLTVTAPGTLTTNLVSSFTSTPAADLVNDASGDLFGTLPSGGSNGYGAIFEVVNGQTTISTLASFSSATGTNPGTLTIDAHGDLFGATTGGGANGFGTIFEVLAGSTTITPLASFTSGVGALLGKLGMDSAGDLFGIGATGTIFELPAGSDTLDILGAASFPAGGIAVDPQGDVFGASNSGGADNDGTLYELAKGTSITAELASFTGGNGAFPNGQLLIDSAGDLIGTTSEGGEQGASPQFQAGAGTIFELAHNATTITDRATFDFTDGLYPNGTLFVDSQGDLFGTTRQAGGNDLGTAFELPSDSSKLITLTSFGGTGEPIGTLAMDADGNLYGVAIDVEISSYGLLYQIAAQRFISPASAVFTIGAASTFTIQTAGFGFGTTITATGGPWPIGVSLNDNGDGTATLSGTTGLTTGAYTVNLTATNGNASLVQVFTLYVVSPPTITSANHDTFTAGTTGSFTFTTKPGLPTATVLSLSGTLPKGLSFAKGKGTATLHGTPAPGSGGVYNLTLFATNGPESVAQQPFTLTVDAAPAFTSAAQTGFVHGQSNTFTITTRGFPAPTLSLTSGTLPGGIQFTPGHNGTATLSGTPTAGSGVSFITLQLTATGLVGAKAMQTFTLVIGQTPTFNGNFSATFTAGTKVSFPITTTGGSPVPITLTEKGSLPAGVTFKPGPNGAATLHGTPASMSGGTYSITVTAANGAQSAVTQTYTLTVDARPAFTTSGSVTFASSQNDAFLVKTAGFPAATLSASPSLSGITFTSESGGKLLISGMPAANLVGPHTLTINAVSGSVTAKQTFTLTVDVPPTITSPAEATFPVGTTGGFSVTTHAGTPATTTVRETGVLPKGVVFTAANGGATLHGKPEAGAGGTYSLTLIVANAVGSATPQTFMLTVNEAPSFIGATTAVFVVGQSGTFAIASHGFPRPKLSATGLPPGLSFTDNGNGTATINGIPEAGTAQVYTVTLSALQGTTPVTEDVTVTVKQPPLITSPDGTTFQLGQSGTFTITTSGLPAPTITVIGKLPAGVKFKANKNGTATLSGKPTAKGTTTFTIAVADGVVPSAYQTFTLTVM